jgi:hypothetical protein
MYVLEIETKNRLKKIENPRKARIRDRIFFDSLQVMDENGKWHTICNCLVGVGYGRMIVYKINSAIEQHLSSVYVDI